MKKISVITLILILFYLSGYSQEVNSVKNTGQTLQVDLNQSLKKAWTLKTTGLVMTIAGPVLIGAGIVMEIGWMEGGGAVLATGLISTAADSYINYWFKKSKQNCKHIKFSKSSEFKHCSRFCAHQQ